MIFIFLNSYHPEVVYTAKMILRKYNMCRIIIRHVCQIGVKFETKRDIFDQICIGMNPIQVLLENIPTCVDTDNTDFRKMARGVAYVH